MARTTDDLVSEIQLTGVFPSNQELLTPDRILAFATEQTQSKVLPIIQALNQEYFVTYDLISLQNNQQAYAIPTRALGRTLRDVKIQDTGGRERSLPLIKLEDLYYYTASSSPSGFYMLGDKIMILPPPVYASGYSLKLYYLQRPGRYVTVSSCSKVLSVSSDNLTFTTLTVDQVPTTFLAGTICDVIQGIEGNSTLAKDQPITNIAGTSITFGLLSSAIGAGDYIAPQYCSPVLQFPEEGFGYLVAITTEKCLKALGDFDGAKAVSADAPEMKKFFESMIAPRIAGENIKVINRNGLLRGARGRGRGVLYP